MFCFLISKDINSSIINHIVCQPNCTLLQALVCVSPCVACKCVQCAVALNFKIFVRSEKN